MATQSQSLQESGPHRPRTMWKSGKRRCSTSKDRGHNVILGPIGTADGAPPCVRLVDARVLILATAQMPQVPTPASPRTIAQAKQHMLRRALLNLRFDSNRTGYSPVHGIVPKGPVRGLKPLHSSSHDSENLSTNVRVQTTTQPRACHVNTLHSGSAGSTRSNVSQTPGTANQRSASSDAPLLTKLEGRRRYDQRPRAAPSPHTVPKASASNIMGPKPAGTQRHRVGRAQAA